MPDRENVIKAIECCVVNRTRCFDDNDKLCPYFSTKVYMCEIELLNDALALLKEQEAVKPEWFDGTPFCGNCGHRLEKKNRNTEIKCSTCRRLVKW